jgi:hypothetical protein
MAEKQPENTAELLSQIEGEWKELMRVVGHLTPEQMAKRDAGGWSPKDNLAHLAAWMQFMRGRYLEKRPAHEAMGIERDTYEKLDEDGINAVLFERNRDLTAEQVMQQIHRAYGQVTKALREMPFAELMKPRVDDPEKRPVLVWVLGNTSEHYAEHRANIEKGL